MEPNDDWKGSYDSWKTTDPRDLEPEEPRAEQDPDDARDEAIERAELDKQWDDYEEDGPLDLEDQLENALNRGFP
jgi:hypothetical protein